MTISHLNIGIPLYACQDEKTVRVPLIRMASPLAFRGVWEHWKAPDGNIELHTNLSPCLNEECRPTPAAIGSFPVVAGAASLLEKLLLFPFVRERTTIYPAPSVYETRTGVM